MARPGLRAQGLTSWPGSADTSSAWRVLMEEQREPVWASCPADPPLPAGPNSLKHPVPATATQAPATPRRSQGGRLLPVPCSPGPARTQGLGPGPVHEAGGAGVLSCRRGGAGPRPGPWRWQHLSRTLCGPFVQQSLLSATSWARGTTRAERQFSNSTLQRWPSRGPNCLLPVTTKGPSGQNNLPGCQGFCDTLIYT